MSTTPYLNGPDDPRALCPLCNKRRDYPCELGCNTCKNNMKRIKTSLEAKRKRQEPSKYKKAYLRWKTRTSIAGDADS